MTWQGKRRKQLPTNWGAVRKARLEYDGYRCTAWVTERSLSADGLVASAHTWPCPQRATEVDHAFDPHDHRLEALRSLCHTHHMEKTQAEAAAARARSTTPKLQRARPQAKHPGLA